MKVPKDVIENNSNNELLYIKNDDCLGDFKNTDLQENYKDKDEIKLYCFYNLLF